MDELRFNPTNQYVISILRLVGLDEELIQTGRLTKKTTPPNMPFEGFRILFSLRGDPSELDPLEARLALKLLEDTRRQLMINALFNSRTCPSRSPSGSTILANIFYNPGRDMGKMIPEVACPYQPNGPYKNRDLLGIHYVETMIPGTISKGGQAVYQIKSDSWRGSGVQISQGGDFVTARHVIYDDDDSFGAGLKILIPGNPIRIYPYHIVEEDQSHDFIRLNLPELSGGPFVSITAKTPSLSDELWAVGFPGLDYRVYTIGEFRSHTNGVTISTNHILGGYSGGALLNKDGELVGILSSAKSIRDLPDNVLETQAYFPISKVISPK